MRLYLITLLTALSIAFFILLVITQRKIKDLQEQNVNLRHKYEVAESMRHFTYEKLTQLEGCVQRYDEEKDEAYRALTPVRAYCVSFNN